MPTDQSRAEDDVMRDDWKQAWKDEVARAEKAEAEIERLRAALERIAREDYRGNRPESARIAEEALRGS